MHMVTVVPLLVVLVVVVIVDMTDISCDIRHLHMHLYFAIRLLHLNFPRNSSNHLMDMTFFAHYHISCRCTSVRFCCCLASPASSLVTEEKFLLRK